MRDAIQSQARHRSRRGREAFVAVACAAALLAATHARAVSVVEPRVPGPGSEGDIFGDTFEMRTSIVGLEVAIGEADGACLDFTCPDNNDYIGFAGLTPGEPFQIWVRLILTDMGMTARLYDGAGTLLAQAFPHRPGDVAFWTGVVPASAELVVGTFASDDFARYQLTWGVAEPASSPLGAASLLAGAAVVGSRLRRGSPR